MKNIIFDWSGVVKDTVTAQLWIVNKIFEKHAVKPLTLDEFRDNWKQPYNLFYRKYLLDKFDEEERMQDYKRFAFDPNCPETTLFPDMVELIKLCKSKGYFLAVVSSDMSETLFTEIKGFGLESVFDKVVAYADDKLGEVESIVAEYNLDIDNTFFIGDSNHEIEVAKEVGMKSIAVTWGFTSETRLKVSNPDYVVSTVQELKSIIL